jgi:hypothetical protein
MNIFNQSRYNFDAGKYLIFMFADLLFHCLSANPPKLHVYHYNALQKVNPALYGQFFLICACLFSLNVLPFPEEWVSLRTINWKLQNQLRPLGV